MSRRKKKQLSLSDNEVAEYLNSLQDEVLSQFSFPLYSNTTSSVHNASDADGFPLVSSQSLSDFSALQQSCWDKAEANPQINSHVRDIMGRMAGWGFNFTSERIKINQALDEIMEDPRNDLYQNFPKFVARTEIEGELHLMLTLHDSGFVEVDFIAPSMIRGGGDKGSGIIFHPTKQTFPLMFILNFDKVQHNDASFLEAESQVMVPSVNLMYYPELEKFVKDHSDYDEKKTKPSKAERPNEEPYKQLNGYRRFIVQWNKGFMTRRNVSHIRTTIEWVNYYEALKKYEIDHKKSSGAYLWVITMDDVQAFRRWLSMSEEERKRTGIMQTKDPGGTLLLPPGMKMECHNPKLNSISEQDTDIMQMVTSGLQKPQDTLTGDYRSTYASVKASQGPQGDRINDELHYFKLFLMYSFWRPILYLRSLAREDFKYYRIVKDVIRFEKGEPVYGRVKKPAYKFIDICLPTSRLEDIEAFSKAYLGSKHASLVDVLGIPRREIAKRLGFSNYASLRKEKTIEDDIYPETLSAWDQEAAQEKAEAEPPTKKPDEDKTKKKPEQKEPKK